MRQSSKIKPESKGFIRAQGKVKDCTVRALVNASRQKFSYQEVEQALAAAGRKENDGCDAYTWFPVYTKQFNCQLRAVCGNTKDAKWLASWLTAENVKFKRTEGFTLQRAMLHMRKGGWLVVLNEHVTAVVDGKLIDYGTLNGNVSVQAVFKVCD